MSLDLDAILARAEAGRGDYYADERLIDTVGELVARVRELEAENARLRALPEALIADGDEPCGHCCAHCPWCSGGPRWRFEPEIAGLSEDEKYRFVHEDTCPAYTAAGKVRDIAPPRPGQRTGGEGE